MKYFLSEHFGESKLRKRKVGVSEGASGSVRLNLQETYCESIGDDSCQPAGTMFFWLGTIYPKHGIPCINDQVLCRIPPSGCVTADGGLRGSTSYRTTDAASRGDVVIAALPVVLAECVFVLESFYRHPGTDIASALGRLISSPGVEIGEVTVHLDALNRYKGNELTLLTV
jgi:hypothetical protein